MANIAGVRVPSCTMPLHKRTRSVTTEAAAIWVKASYPRIRPPRSSRCKPFGFHDIVQAFLSTGCAQGAESNRQTVHS